jgi:SAM-dependent methyltransferase
MEMNARGSVIHRTSSPGTTGSPRARRPPNDRWSALTVEILFVVLFAILSPVYYVNRWNFVRGKKRNPFYTSLLVRAEQRYPWLYELAAYLENFPRWERVYDILPDFSGDVLQVGCGTGLLNRHLRSRDDIRFTNLDVNVKALRFGLYLKRFATFVHAAIDRGTSFADESFDVVLFSRSFHHIRYHKRALKECARLLRDGGTVLIADPVVLRAKGRTSSSGGYMVNSSIDGIIWRFTLETFAQHLEECLPQDLTIQSVRCVRQHHVSNYNSFVPQADVVAVLIKRSRFHAGQDPPATGPR